MPIQEKEICDTLTHSNTPSTKEKGRQRYGDGGESAPSQWPLDNRNYFLYSPPNKLIIYHSRFIFPVSVLVLVGHRRFPLRTKRRRTGQIFYADHSSTRVYMVDGVVSSDCGRSERGRDSGNDALVEDVGLVLRVTTARQV